MQSILPRFQSKKAFKEAVAAGKHVSLEATSVFGNEYGGDITQAPDGNFCVVGPSPYERKWYASIKKTGSVIKIS